MSSSLFFDRRDLQARCILRYNSMHSSILSNPVIANGSGVLKVPSLPSMFRLYDLVKVFHSRIS